MTSCLGMRSQRPFLHRIPDWHLACIDSKWKWSLPWGIFSTGLLVLMVVATSLWNHEILGELSRYATSESFLELSLRDSKQTVHVGRRSVHFSRTLAYHRRFNAKPAPTTELYHRFSDVPWDG